MVAVSESFHLWMGMKRTWALQTRDRPASLPQPTHTHIFPVPPTSDLRSFLWTKLFFILFLRTYLEAVLRHKNTDRFTRSGPFVYLFEYLFVVNELSNNIMIQCCGLNTLFKFTGWWGSADPWVDNPSQCIAVSSQWIDDPSHYWK